MLPSSPKGGWSIFRRGEEGVSPQTVVRSPQTVDRIPQTEDRNNDFLSRNPEHENPSPILINYGAQVLRLDGISAPFEANPLGPSA